MNNPSSTLKYSRILLKYSGEALLGALPFGIDPQVLNEIAKTIASVHQLGVEVGIVIGGGNLFRGKTLSEEGLGRVTADQMGMLATIMNALALRDALIRLSVDTRIMSAIPMTGVVDPYDCRKAIKQLQKGQVLIFASGTGSPYFTTDTAACLRAIEINSQIVLKATKVDGVYSSDPKKDLSAVRFEFLSYSEVINGNLQVMDKTAICLCEEQNMPLQVFDMNDQHALMKIIHGERVGTVIGAKDDQ